jgi:hypothetical protein
MEKIDLKKKFKHLYLPSAKEVVLVDVPEFQFVMIDGQIEAGDTPESSESFHDAMGALYGASYTLKFMSKLRERDPVDYTVMALEGLWSSRSGGFDLQQDEPWMFTMMMMQPDHITSDMFQEALHRLEEKKPNPAISKLRFEKFCEGLCVQIMHVGPYAEEKRTIEKMEAFVHQNECRFSGKHHEIYIGDPRRAKPENLRTVLRSPVVKLL